MDAEIHRNFALDPAAPWGGFEPPTWRLHRTPRFPAGVDYLFAIALQALGAGRIVSEPSRTPSGLGCGLPWRQHAVGFPQFTQ
jgi:hypothetical protein